MSVFLFCGEMWKREELNLTDKLFFISEAGSTLASETR